MQRNQTLLNQLELSILPGKNPERHQVKLYERAYHFWLQFWTQVLNDVQSNTQLNPDDFFRQDHILVLHIGHEIIAMHLYSEFNFFTPLMQEHSYFKNDFPEQYFTELEKLSIRRTLSMEYLSVNPLYRKSSSSLLTAQILISLGVKFFLEKTKADSIVALVRNDNNAFSLCSTFGLKELKGVPREIKNNCETVFAIATREDVKFSQNLEVYRLVEKLWQNYSNPLELDYKLTPS